MRVLVLHNAGRPTLPSGETRVFHSEVEALRDAGLQVETYLLTSQANESLAHRLVAGTRVMWSRPSYRAVRTLAAKFQPDVVHAHSVLPDLTVAAFAACRDSGVPVVQTLHNYRWVCIEGGLYRNGNVCKQCLAGDWRPGVRNRCARGSLLASVLLTANNHRYVRSGRLFSLVTRFIAVSHYSHKQYVNAGFPESQVVVKYHSVECLADHELLRMNDRDGRICFAGRLDPAKGTAIVRQLVDRNPAWRWCVMGDGPELNTWMKLRNELGRDRLEVTGHLTREEVRHRLARASVVVVPSLVPETFGLVAAEAMACGTPVVASHVGGLIELVHESGAGVAVAPERGAGAFADAIESLTTDNQRWQRASDAGRRFVRQHLDRRKLTEQLVSIYASVLSRGL